MIPRRLPAVFMRGGTSKALVFHARDLPEDRSDWDAIFLSAMGSPDPHGRQLNGMGGGTSSLSKACVIAPSNRNDADIDYTFAQVAVKEARVDYNSNCGNMSSAIGPFAIDENLLTASDGETTVRIFNTNTRKMIHSTFRVQGGRAVLEGEFEIPGVAGRGAPIRLDFLEPGGASTGKLLPTGKPVDIMDVPGVGRVEVSMVDAANACAFVTAESLGITGTEMPDDLDRNIELLEKLASIRARASVAMGISGSLDEAHTRAAIPLIGFVSPAQDARVLSGERLSAAASDLTVRMISNGQAHRALPLTASVCIAIAARIKDTTVFRATRTGAGERLRLAMPSGVLTVSAEVREQNNRSQAVYGSLFRTARRLFDGFVYV
jgi:2-methylaconitate cis-trans-isomerase PrpF